LSANEHRHAPEALLQSERLLARLADRGIDGCRIGIGDGDLVISHGTLHPKDANKQSRKGIYSGE